MSVFNYNGGAMVAIAGKNCVALGCDKRLGVQMTTVAMNMIKVFKIQDNILLGLTGFATDVQTFAALMKFKVNLFNLRQTK